MDDQSNQPGGNLSGRESYLSSIYEYCPYAILLTEPGGGILAANPAACKLFNMTEEEICRAGRTRLVDQNDPRLTPALQIRQQSGKFYGDLRFIRRNGERFEGEVASIVFTDENRETRTSMVIRDVSEEKSLIQKIIDAEQVYHTVADNTYDWEIWIDPDGKLLYCSPSCLRITGYSHQSFIGSPELLTQIIHPDDLKCYSDHVNLPIPGPPVDIEFRIIRIDGSIRWIGHICQAVFSKEGQYLGRRCSNRDITDRKQFEDSIILSENRYRGLFENSIVGISQADPDGRLICVNQAYAEIYGYSSPEEIMQAFDNIGDRLYANPDERKIVLDLINEKGSIPVREVKVRKKDGTEATFLVTACAVRDSTGKIQYYQAEQIDISPLKDLEARMDSTERMAQTTIDSLADMICVIDPCGNILYVNNAWCKFLRIYGKTQPDNGVGRNVLEIWKTIMGEFRPEYQEIAEGYASLMEGRIDEFDLEFLLHSPERKGVWFSWLIKKIPNSPEHRYIITTRDISERKKILDERDRLINQVRLSNEKLRALSRRLLDAHETERRVIARELHDEIGQELTALKIELLQTQQLLTPADGSSNTPAPDLKKAISTIENTMSQIRKLSLDLHPAVLDDLGLVPAIRWLLSNKIPNSTFQTEFQTDLEDLRFLPEVEVACYRIIQEAITNSMKHARATLLKIELWCKFETLHLSIFDDGVGFNPEDGISTLESVETFGLISMRERARLVGGRLEIHSTPGKGTLVTAYFPISQTYHKVERKNPRE